MTKPPSSASAKRKKAMAPNEWRRFSEILAAPRDNLTAGDFWIMADNNTVTICAQRAGEPTTARVIMPARHFRRLVHWYVTGEVPRPKRRKK